MSVHQRYWKGAESFTEIAKSPCTDHLYLNKDHQGMRKWGPQCESPAQCRSPETLVKHQEVYKGSTGSSSGAPGTVPLAIQKPSLTEIENQRAMWRTPKNLKGKFSFEIM